MNFVFCFFFDFGNYVLDIILPQFNFRSFRKYHPSPLLQKKHCNIKKY